MKANLKCRRSARRPLGFKPGPAAEGLAQAERGDFASDARIAELWKRAGP